MKAHYRPRSNRLTFEVEGQSPKELFRAIAELQGIFEADAECGCCASTNLQHRVRTVDEGDHYELMCTDCTCGPQKFRAITGWQSRNVV